MAENGYGPTPVVGHVGRIPNYGKTQVNQFGNTEPPACIQNAMMTKDKKPFTYTPGGLDLSQIKTPSMARRMARQRSLEDQEQVYAQGNGNYHPQGGPVPPPPPPMKIPVPPPPPPLVIEAPNNKTPNPPAIGERPEIVIPENPIGMLRKTNSPYHWEAEKAEQQRIGPVPKFVEKVPSPLTVKLPQHNTEQSYGSPLSNYRQNTYGNQYQSPDSPLRRPEAQYGNQKSMSPGMNGSPPTREILQRQDSQFNKSPQPFGNQSPLVNSTPYSPTPNNHWRQPERRDSPAKSSPQSPHINRGMFSPNLQQNSPNYNQGPENNVFHTLPRVGQRNQEVLTNNVQNNYSSPVTNNVREVPQQNAVSNTAPWRSSTLNRYPRENQQTILNNNQQESQPYSPPWKGNDANNNQSESNFTPTWKRDNKNNSSQPNDTIQNKQSWINQEANKVPDTYTTPWRSQETERSAPNSPPETRYQSSISIPVNPRKQPSQPQYNNNPIEKEVVYVNEEPVYYCPESPKSLPPWVKSQKEKTKTPPPVWCQRPLDGTKPAARELETPPRDTNQEPEWVRKSNEMQRGAREVVSPPKYQQSAQPNWSTRPSENRKSLPRDNTQQQQPSSRIIPIQMEVTSTETRNQRHQGTQQPQLRIVIDMKQNGQNQPQTQAPLSQPTQRIMRVLSPQLVKLDEGSADRDLPSLNRSFQYQDSQPKTRIIPIQVEDGNGGANKRVYYHNVVQEAPQRQSRSFKVLQVVTGTGPDDIQIIEDGYGYSDL